MSNSGSVGSSAAGGAVSCFGGLAGAVGGGSGAFGGTGSVVLLSVGSSALSTADVEISGGIFAVSGSAALSAEVSVLSETEAVVCSCDAVLCTGSVITVSLEDDSTSERSAFAQPEAESVSSTKAAIIHTFLMFANLLCRFIVRAAAENGKAARTAASCNFSFSGSTAIVPYPAGAPVCDTAPAP